MREIGLKSWGHEKAPQLIKLKWDKMKDFLVFVGVVILFAGVVCIATIAGGHSVAGDAIGANLVQLKANMGGY